MPYMLAALVRPRCIGAAGAAPGYLPAVVLASSGISGGLDRCVEHLLGRSWVYAEAPFRLTAIPPARPDTDAPRRSAGQPILFVPCQAPGSQTLPALNRPPDTHGEWCRRVRGLGHRCAIVLAPPLDPDAEDFADQVDDAARRGRIVWTIARMTHAPRPTTHRRRPVHDQSR